MKFLSSMIVASAICYFLVWGAVSGHTKVDHAIHKYLPAQEN